MMYDELDDSIDPELQLRLLNLVLGEASDFERDQLQILMEQQPELLSHFRRLLHLHGLLRDVGLGDPIVCSPGESAESERANPEVDVDNDASWRLSDERRAIVLNRLQSSTSAPATSLSEANPPQHPWWKLSRKRVIEIAALAACLLVFVGLLLPAVQAPREAARRIGMMRNQFDDFEVGGGAATSSSVAANPPSPALSAAETHYRELMNGRKSDFGDSETNAELRQSDKTGYWGFLSSDSGSKSAQPQGPKPPVDMPESPTAPTKDWMDAGVTDRTAGMPSVMEDREGRGGGRASIARGEEPQSRSIQPPFGNPDLSTQPAQAGDTATLLYSITPRITIPKEEESLESREKSGESLGDLNASDEGKPASDFDRDMARQLRLGSQGLVVPEEALKQKQNTPKFQKDAWDIQPGKPQNEENLNGATDNTTYFRHLSDLENKPTQADDAIAHFDSSKGIELKRHNILQRDKNDEIAGKPLRLDQTVEGRMGRAPFEVSPMREPASTFSLHVSDVSFKLAQSALAQGQLPEPSSIRIEEFVNAMDYRDPLPGRDAKVSCVVEQAIHPFRLQRNLLRVSLRTAAFGRTATTPLRLTVLLDNSGSMERPDRRASLLRAVQSLTQQLNANDQVTLIAFARTAHLLADQVRGDQSGTLLEMVERLPSDGGTNLEAALMLAREKALEQRKDGAQNRIVLMTDGAVNLGNANPESLAQQIVQLRASGIALDVAGIGVRDLKDEVLEVLAREGDGRYYLLDNPESVEGSFANQIAGALRPTAMNVKVQVEFNPLRVASYKLYGFDNHLLQAEDFRNDRVDAAELSAEEAGVAIYQFEPIADGSGEVGSISVRFRDAVSGEMVEHRWPIPYEPSAPKLDVASPSMKLASATALFAAKLAGGPLSDNVEIAPLAAAVATLPDSVLQHPRVQQLRSMMQSARDLQ